LSKGKIMNIVPETEVNLFRKMPHLSPVPLFFAKDGTGWVRSKGELMVTINGALFDFPTPMQLLSAHLPVPPSLQGWLDSVYPKWREERPECVG